MIVWPAASTTCASAGTATSVPTAAIRLRSTTSVPFSMTSSPSIVTMRAFVKATVPVGTSAGSSSPSATPVVSISGSSSGAPGRKAKASRRSRVKYSGPVVQWIDRLSADQWRSRPASRETRATGIAFVSLLRSMEPPVLGNGAT